MKDFLSADKCAARETKKLVKRMNKRTESFAKAVAALTAHFKEELYKEGKNDNRFLTLTAPKEIYEALLPKGVDGKLASKIRRVDLIFQAALQAAALNVSKDRFWNSQHAIKTCVTYKAMLDGHKAEVKIDLLRQVKVGVSVLEPRFHDEGLAFDSGLWKERVYTYQQETIKTLLPTKFSYPT